MKFWKRKVGYLLLGITLFILLYAFQIVPVAAQPSIAVLTTPTATHPVTAFASVSSANGELSVNPAQLPPLPYADNALEKVIDAETLLPLLKRKNH